ncbi:hypothetical protein Peur_016048 [Populus x canadensis]
MIPNAASSIPEEVKEFDATKAGVKGLVDSGVTKIPRFFVHPPEDVQKLSSEINGITLQLPIIDLEGFESFRRLEVVDEEVKKELYSRDKKKPVRFYYGASSLTIKPSVWKDSAMFYFKDGKLDPELIPDILSEEISAYNTHIKRISKILSELLSEALGLRPDYLLSIECMESELITNDKLRSARHRVFSGEVGPRISITCFLYPSSAKNLKQYGIIKELQHGNPAIYRKTDTAELREEIRVSGPSPSTLSRFKE